MITSPISRATFAGTGSTGPFGFTFKIFDPTNLRVTKLSVAGVPTTLSYPADFSVAGIRVGVDAYGGGGNITLAVALAVGELLTVRRAPSLTQNLSLQNQGPYPPKSIEDQVDYLTMMVQSHEDVLGRSFRLTEANDPVTFNSIIAAPGTGQVLGWNASGLTAVTLATPVGVAIPGAGRTTATLSAFIANNAVFNWLDYGADPLGVIDSTNPVNNALAAASAVAGGAASWGPPGTYKITAGLSLTGPDVIFIGDQQGATILKANAASFNILTLASTAHRAVIKYMRFYGAATTNGTLQYGIYTLSQVAPNDVTIEGCRFGGPNNALGLNSAVLLDGLGVSGGGVRWRIINNHVDNLIGDIPGTGYGFLLSRAWHAYCAGNTYVGNGAGKSRHAYYLANAWYCRIIGNHMENIHDVNIVIADYVGSDGVPGAKHNIIANNVIKGGGFDSNAVAGIGLYGLAQYNLITGNNIDGFKGRASIEVSKAATPQTPIENDIIGNTITNGDQFGINVQGATQTVVSGNVLRDGSLLSPGTYAAIKVQGDNATTASVNTTIIGNVVRSQTPTWRCGVSIDGTAPAPTGTVILYNHFPDNTPPIETNGVTCVARWNQSVSDPISGDRGDNSITWTPGQSEDVQLFNTPISAPRTVTLSTTNVTKGTIVRVVRTAAATGASALTVNGKALTPGTWLECEWSSQLAAYVNIGTNLASL